MIQTGPLSWTGSGGATVRFPKPLTDAMVVTTTWTGPAARNTVVALGKADAVTDVLVDTTGDYRGSSLVNRTAGASTSGLRLQGQGQWQVSLTPLTQARRWEGSPALKGSSDDVVVVSDAFSSPRSVSFTSDSTGPVRVLALGEANGRIIDGVGTFSGVYAVPAETVVLLVSSAGDWSFTLK